MSSSSTPRQRGSAHKADTDDVRSNSTTATATTMMSVAEKELREVNRKYAAGELDAFGGQEQSLLRQIDYISQMQVRSFLSSMEIELKYPNVVNPSSSSSGDHTDSADQSDEQYADFDSDSQQFTNVSRAFQEKEKAIGKLVQDLQTISKSMFRPDKCHASKR